MEKVAKEISARDVVYAIQDDFNEYYDSVIDLKNLEKLVGDFTIVPSID